MEGDTDAGDLSCLACDQDGHLWLDEDRGLTPSFAFCSSSGAPIDALTRHGTAIERGPYRALHELERLRAGRAGEPVPVPVAVDVTLDAPAPAARLVSQGVEATGTTLSP